MSTQIAPQFTQALSVIGENDLALTSSGSFNIAARRHPVYLKNVGEWRFLYDAYRGGKDYISNPNNLKRHSYETDALFRQRLARAYYYNYCGPIIDATVNHLFKGGVIRENSEMLADFYEEVNDNGSDMNFFMRDVATQAGIFGKVSVLVDMPKATPEEMAARERGEATRLFDQGKTPRLFVYAPTNVLDWSTGADGLNWVLLQHEEREDLNPFVPAKNKQIYELWDRTSWTSYNKDGRRIDGGEHSLGIVPFVTISNIGLDQSSTGESTIKDIAHINNNIYQLCSLLDEIFHRQAFSQLVAEGNPKEYDAQAMSTAGAFCYPLGRKPPGFISPDASQAELHMKQIDSMIGEIYRIANIKINANENRLYKTIVQSQYDFEAFNSVLKNKARALEKFETDVNYILSLWLQQPDIASINVQYPAEFDTTLLSDDVAEASQLNDLGMGDVFMQMYKRNIAKKRFPDADEEMIDKIAAAFTEATATVRF